MKFTCDKAALVSALSTAMQVVSPKSPISALEGILLQCGVHLFVSGYNLETGITVTVREAEVSEYGACVMPARLFFDIVRKLPDDEVYISIDENSYKVNIRSGIASFDITAMSSEDYPEIPDVELDQRTFIPQKELRALINGTLFCASEDKTRRPVYTGALVEVDPDTITMVTVDGFRLAKRTYRSNEGLDRDLRFVAPASALKELEKILEDIDENASFIVGKKYLQFRANDVTLVCRRLEGDFGDWRSFLPQSGMFQLCANRTRLMASIDRVSLLVTEKFKCPVRCTFGSNRAEFRTTNTIGEAYDVCVMAGEGHDLEIGFNGRYLIEALRAAGEENVVLGLKDGLSPILFTSPSPEQRDKYIYMILPVRLKAE